MKNKLNLPELESKKVFAYFEELAAIPHGSRNTRQISDYLIYSGFTGYLVKLLYPLLRLILPASRNGSFVLLSGFLFGFPMGSKNCAEMLKCGQLEYQEAEILFMVTNNISPVFISSYILCQRTSPSAAAVTASCGKNKI